MSCYGDGSLAAVVLDQFIAMSDEGHEEETTVTHNPSGSLTSAEENLFSQTTFCALNVRTQKRPRLRLFSSSSSFVLFFSRGHDLEPSAHKREATHRSGKLRSRRARERGESKHEVSSRDESECETRRLRLQSELFTCS